jgi:exosortase/archaeosortase family protein
VKRARRLTLVPFVMATAAATAVILFGPHAPVRAGLYGWLDVETARAVAAALRLCGWRVAAEGPVVSHPSGFAMEIYYRCTGLLPAAFVALAVLAFPAPARLRLRGAVGGVVLVVAVNFARLIGLMAVGIEVPQLFDVSHRLLGEALIVLSVFWYWLAWARRASTLHGGGGVHA